MTSAIGHRGRDDEGYVFISTADKSYSCAGGRDTPQAVWESSHIFSPRSDVAKLNAATHGCNLALGQKRLADFDLSAAGHQPISNESGTIWLVADSDIYNYPELKEKLTGLGHSFFSNSDAEVIVHAYEQWGMNCLHEFNGAWAFALFDISKKILFCACDRFGLKPFYYFFNGKVFIFASEIKALLEHPAVPRNKNDAVIYNYLLWGFSSHSEATFFKDICIIKHACYLIVDSVDRITQEKWWELKVNPAIGSGQGNDETVQRNLRFLLEDALKLRAGSNLPCGFFLSGGLDSSAIVCLSKRLINDKKEGGFCLSNNKLRTFSSCIEKEEYNEISFIESVIRDTGAEKNYIFPDGDSLWNELPELVRYQEEPFPGIHIYAQWATIKLAKESGIKVLYDGQGGDEIFGGYPWYFGSLLANMLLQHDYRGFLHESGKIDMKTNKQWLLESAINIAGWDVYHLLPFPVQSALMETTLKVRGRAIPRLINRDLHRKHKNEGLTAYRNWYMTINNLNNHMHTELNTRLVSLLLKGDKNSMAFTTLVRNPLLDHRIVEYMFSLPANYKIRDGWSKWIQRQSVKDIIPEEVYRRTLKLGFPVPNYEWLLMNRDKIKMLFDAPHVLCEEYIDVSNFRKNLDRLFSQEQHSWEIWQLTVMEMWLRTYFK